jgi:hypothetical protein
VPKQGFFTKELHFIFSDLCLVVRDRRVNTDVVRRLILQLVGWGEEDVIVGLITNLGTADAYYNSLPREGRERMPLLDLREAWDQQLFNLAEACRCCVLECGPGYPYTTK